MSLVLYISLGILVGFIIGWFSRVLIIRWAMRILAKRKRQIGLKPGESAREQYQRYKDDKLNLKPIEPPPGTSPEAAERFRKLSPMHQHQTIAALRKLSEKLS